MSHQPLLLHAFKLRLPKIALASYGCFSYTISACTPLSTLQVPRRLRTDTHDIYLYPHAAKEITPRAPPPYPAPAPGIVWPSRGTDILLTWSCTLGPWPFSFAVPDLSHTVALFLLLCPPPCYTSVVGAPAGGHRPTHNRSL